MPTFRIVHSAGELAVTHASSGIIFGRYMRYGVRQGSVLSPFLYAVYVDGIYIILYADNILIAAVLFVSWKMCCTFVRKN